MGISKTEINLRRLVAPQQQNQSKLIQYIATLHEQLAQLAKQRTPEGLPIVSKAQVNDYSEKIEALTFELVTPLPDIQVSEGPAKRNSFKESPYKTDGESHMPSSPGLRRRFVPASNVEDRAHGSFEADASEQVKLDAGSHAYDEKHRKFQEILTDEMVGLACQLKESSLMLSRSSQNTKNILNSTEKAVERSLANTRHANVRAMKMYSESSKTTAWLLMFVMTCVFITVVLLIRVT